jgi:hypothetical protein
VGGYTPAELATAQDRYGLRFPPDLIETMLKFRPNADHDWSIEDPRIRTMLAWPFEALKFDIVEGGMWWPDWGYRPQAMADRIAILREALTRAPRLIPLGHHRYLPETPIEADNPIFSMHGFDTIYYGANLADYFENEATGRPASDPMRRIVFWSDIAENHHLSYYPDVGA